VDRRQLGFTVSAVVLALVLGAGVALLATSGDGDDEASVGPQRSSTTSSSTPSTTTTTALIPRPVVTVPTSPPPTVRVVPPPTDAPTTTTPTTKTTRTTKVTKPKRKRAPKTTTTTVAGAAVPQAAPSTEPTAPPTTSTTTSTSTTTTSTTTSSTTTSSTTTTTTTAPAPPPEVGLSVDEIRLTVLADDARTLDGASAWANAVNRDGGLAGRDIRLDLVATDGTTETFDRAVDAACERSFAIVASHAASGGAEVALQRCGIPDVPVEASSATHAANATTFAAFPRQPRTEAVGPYRGLQDELDRCCSQFVLVPADGPDRTSTEASIDAAAEIGFETAATPDVALDASSTDYDALAQDLSTSGATFAASGLGADSTLELRRAAATAGVTGVAAWYCDDRCYDSSVSADSGADGEYVGIETVPFGDRRDVPELRAYQRAAARTQRPTSYEGLRAYVAGVLFEQAVADVVADHGPDGLTRPRLVESLGAVHDFTGRGLVGSTDVGARAPNGCFVLLQLDEGQFARVAPAERGSLDCGSQNLVQLEG
jgi:ABC-type branched-subunit amino acid transport system substrate-binding protein